MHDRLWVTLPERRDANGTGVWQSGGMPRIATDLRACSVLIGADVVISACARDHWSWRWAARLTGCYEKVRTPPDVRAKIHAQRRCGAIDRSHGRAPVEASPRGPLGCHRRPSVREAPRRLALRARGVTALVSARRGINMDNIASIAIFATRIAPTSRVRALKAARRSSFTSSTRAGWNRPRRSASRDAPRVGRRPAHGQRATDHLLTKAGRKSDHLSLLSIAQPRTRVAFHLVRSREGGSHQLGWCGPLIGRNVPRARTLPPGV